MLIMINGDNKLNMKRDNVRIIRIILDLYGVIILICSTPLSSNKPTRPGISSFSNEAQVSATKICLR